MLERSNSCTVILLVSFRLFIHKEHRFHSRDRRTFVQLLLLLFLGLFTELEHCPTHVLLSFLVQKVQNLEISMPAQCHYFDELLLTMIKREHFSTQLLLIFTSVCLGMLEIGIFEECYSLSFFQNLELTRYSSRGSLVHIGRFCYFYQKRAI